MLTCAHARHSRSDPSRPGRGSADGVLRIRRDPRGGQDMTDHAASGILRTADAVEAASAKLAPTSLGLALPALPAGGHRDEDLVRLARCVRFGAEAWAALAPHVGFDARQYRRV